MTNAGKTVLLVQASLFQAQIWKLALESQGLQLFAESPETDLAHTVADMEAAGQILPSLILIDVGIKGVFSPYEFYRWCCERYPKIKVILTNSSQTDIPAFEYQWARLKDPQDILPGFQVNNLISSAMANVNYILAVIEGAPLQEDALSRKLFPIAQRLSEQQTAIPPVIENGASRSPTVEKSTRPFIYGTINPTRFMVIASVILLIAPLGYGVWRLYANFKAQSVHQTVEGTFEQNTRIKTLAQHKGAIFSVITSPDGKTLISASGDHTIKVWDLSTGKVRQTLLGHTGPIVSIAMSTDGQTLASGGRDRTVKLWNLATGKLIRTVSGGAGWVKAVALSSNGQNLVSGNEDKTISVWDVATGSLRYLLTGHSEDLEGLAITPDGQTLASSSGDKTIKLWNLKTGMLLQNLQGHSHEIEGLTISPDGQSLVSGDESEIREWNVQTGKLLRVFPKHSGLVRCVAISPDNKWLASGHTDNTVKLWNFKTGEMINTFSGHSDWVLSVVFDVTGQKVISGSRDKTLKIWPLP
jgi:WD40 repeat protein